MSYLVSLSPRWGELASTAWLLPLAPRWGHHVASPSGREEGREGGSTIFGPSPAFRDADAHGFRIEHVVYEGYALEPESQQGAMPRRYLHVVDEAEFA